MSTNIKKPIRVLNNAKYFEPGRSRVYNTFMSDKTYRYRQIKIEGYETRLYWQFRYCQDHDGQVFYYTLTYNDKSIPKFYGVNCFDYEDLRYLLTGGFYQYLRRNFGTKFKYFVGAELGDGKGSRGMHNNPHYHVLFFLEPDDDPLSEYLKISPESFRHLVRLYWQGFDQDIDGFKDYRDAKFGIAKEGDDCGLVSDFRACCYCAKYVTKDVNLKLSEGKISSYIKFYTKNTYFHSKESFQDFYKANKCLFDTHFASVLPLSVFDFRDSLGFGTISTEYQGDIFELIQKLDLESEYEQFVDSYVDSKVHEVITIYRNRYCNKCRISHGVGSYGLKFIQDLMNPSISVPSKDGFKNRPLPLYLYRKLYTSVINVNSCKKTSRGFKELKYPRVRVLNDLGIDLKVSRLNKSIFKISEQAFNNFILVKDNETLYNNIISSDINTYCNISFKTLHNNLNILLSDFKLSDLFKRYAEYKLVYEGRFFRFEDNRSSTGDSFPVLDLEGDYRFFLSPSTHSVSRSDLRLSTFIESNMAGYLPYFMHPYFLRFYSFFSLFDLLADYFFVQSDNMAQNEAEHLAEIKRFHNKRKLLEFYSSFKSNLL